MIANSNPPTEQQKICKHIFDKFIRIVDEIHDDQLYECSICGWRKIFEGPDY